MNTYPTKSASIDCTAISAGVRILTALLVIFIAGCQILPLKKSDTGSVAEARDWQEQLKHLSQLEDWRIRGKIGYQSKEEAGSAYIDWVQSRDSFHITLSGPLGQGTTIISGNAQGAKIESSRSGVHLADSPEQLLFEHTGLSLPVSDMLYWIKGMPSPSQQENLMLTPQNTLASLHQNQWQISYEGYEANLANWLPTRIKIRSQDVKVTLVVKSWENLPGE